MIEENSTEADWKQTQVLKQSSNKISS